MTLDRETGEVLRWFPDRGFGFIAPDAGGSRCAFFHITSLERGVGVHVGDRVEYSSVTEAKGPRAVAVRVVAEGRCATCTQQG